MAPNAEEQGRRPQLCGTWALECAPCGPRWTGLHPPLLGGDPASQRAPAVEGVGRRLRGCDADHAAGDAGPRVARGERELVAASPEIILATLDDDAAADDRMRADELHQRVLDVKVARPVLRDLDVSYIRFSRRKTPRGEKSTHRGRRPSARRCPVTRGSSRRG